MSKLITFIVPVKSKKLSSNWTMFSKLVERTLGSICKQTDTNFRVVVVCHELPLVTISNDKVDFIQIDFEPPQLVKDNQLSNNALKEKDKAMKILKGLEHAEKYNSSYVMVVDSDDCICNSIASFVNNRIEDVAGWYVKMGYFYREGGRFAFLNKFSFNKFCGTCIIIKPELMKDMMFIEEPHLSFNHKCNPEDIGLIPLPFPAALYSMGNSENHAMTSKRVNSLLNKPKTSVLNFYRSLKSKLSKYSIQLLTPSFRKRFNFHKITT